MSLEQHEFQDKVVGRLDSMDKHISQILDGQEDHEKRLTAIEDDNRSRDRQVNLNTEGVKVLTDKIQVLEDKIEDLPSKFAEVMNEQNVLYLKNFSKRAIRWIGGLVLIGAGAVISELVKAWV